MYYNPTKYAAQEPQWAHVLLNITARGFTTGLLKFNASYFEIEVDLVQNLILIKTEKKDVELKLVNGKSIREYYTELIETAYDLGLPLSIQTKPQEIEWEVPFEDDDTHHYYNNDVAREILKWFQFAWNVEQQFIAPIRQRKVYPGLFWGTFDVACILVYNEFESFPDDSQIIERGAFDEHMIEFGFWLGDEQFDYPTFFTLPYPFVENVELEVDASFPKGSYFSSEMAEYLFEMKEGIEAVDTDEVIQFIKASCRKSMDYLGWEDRDHYFRELKMDENKK